MITLTELTNDQLQIVIQDRRDNAIAANGTEHFFPAMTRYREAAAEVDRRNERIKHQIRELDAIHRATVSAVALVHEATKDGA